MGLSPVDRQSTRGAKMLPWTIPAAAGLHETPTLSQSFVICSARDRPLLYQLINPVFVPLPCLGHAWKIVMGFGPRPWSDTISFSPWTITSWDNGRFRRKATRQSDISHLPITDKLATVCLHLAVYGIPGIPGTSAYASHRRRQS